MSTTLGEVICLSKSEQDAVTECMKSIDSAPLQENSDSEVDLKDMDSVVKIFGQQFKLRTKVYFHSFRNA